MATPVIQGPRLQLRPATASDRDERRALGHAPEVARGFGVTMLQPAEMTAESADAWFARLSAEAHAWVIDVAGHFIGTLTLHSFVDADSRASLAVAIFDASPPRARLRDGGRCSGRPARLRGTRPPPSQRSSARIEYARPALLRKVWVPRGGPGAGICACRRWLGGRRDHGPASAAVTYGARHLGLSARACWRAWITCSEPRTHRRTQLPLLTVGRSSEPSRVR